VTNHCKAVFNPLCLYQCHGCFGCQYVLPMPWLFLFAATAGGLLLAAFIHFFLNRHHHYAIVPVLLCCDAITIIFLAGTVASGWLLFSRKFLRHHHWLDCTSCCHAAAIVPWWWCCCHCAMLSCLHWLSGTVATGWLFFFIIFKSWNIIAQALLHWHYHCTIIPWQCCHHLASTCLLVQLLLFDYFLPHS